MSTIWFHCVTPGFGAAWHLTHVEVEDSAAKQKYMFPCNRWLSKSDDDKLICRELTCANIPSPGVKDKVSEYKDSPLEIVIVHLIKYFLSCETYVTPVYRVQHTGPFIFST